MKPAAFFGSLTIIVACIVMYLLSRDVSIPMLQPMGPIAGAQYRVILVTFLLSSVVMVPVFVLLFYFAWKYRDRSPDAHVHHHPTWDHDSASMEFFWWLIPSAIIAILAIVAWQSSHALDPYVPIDGTQQLEVQVVALNWKWLFIYPDIGVASVNELVIPVGTPVHFMLTADAPINSFWIPSLGGQIMVMSGMQTQLHLLAEKPGTFDGWSGNLSGEGFARMHFKTRALTPDQYDQWVERVHSDISSPLDAEAYESLAQESMGYPVTYYNPVSPDLYTAIHMKYMDHPRQTVH